MDRSSRRKFIQLAGTGLSGSVVFPDRSVFARMELSPEFNPGEGKLMSAPYRATPVTFLSHRLGTDHAEGLAVIDMDGDGKPDVTSGAYWYENPGLVRGEWKRHKFRDLAPLLPSGSAKISKVTNKAFWGEFVPDNGEFAIDVNHDGRLDLVTSSWQNDGVWWFENPGRLGEIWEPHFICHSQETEGIVEGDIDGKMELVAAHYGRQGLFWISFAGAEPSIHYVGGHDQDGHGVGVADIDGDGKADILSVHGWFRNIDAAHDKWEWSPEWELGDCGFPILGYDVNNDGKMDLIFGHGHEYGLYWLEQTTKSRQRHWVRHLIDDSFSQAHALKLADIDGDGQPELLTGKRYRGHNGADPGSYEPLCIYYYKINRQTAEFSRYTISYNGSAGVGTQFVVTDIDGDGDQDVLVAGKTGLHWLENLQVNKVSHEAREKELLFNTEWPFPDEGIEPKE